MHYFLLHAKLLVAFHLYLLFACIFSGVCIVFFLPFCLCLQCVSILYVFVFILYLYLYYFVCVLALYSCLNYDCFGIVFIFSFYLGLCYICITFVLVLGLQLCYAEVCNNGELFSSQVGRQATESH